MFLAQFILLRGFGFFLFLDVFGKLLFTDADDIPGANVSFNSRFGQLRLLVSRLGDDRIPSRLAGYFRRRMIHSVSALSAMRSICRSFMTKYLVYRPDGFKFGKRRAFDKGYGQSLRSLVLKQQHASHFMARFVADVEANKVRPLYHRGI